MFSFLFFKVFMKICRYASSACSFLPLLEYCWVWLGDIASFLALGSS